MDIIQLLLCLDENAYDLISIITKNGNTVYYMDEIPSIMRYTYGYRIKLISMEMRDTRRILVLFLEDKNDCI